MNVAPVRRSVKMGTGDLGRFCGRSNPRIIPCCGFGVVVNEVDLPSLESPHLPSTRKGFGPEMVTNLGQREKGMGQ
jgi:hypothetical protein